MTPSVSHVIPHLCGLSSEKRRRRRLLMAKVYIDDSGSSSNEPVMYVAGLVGQVETWERFADEWEQALVAHNPKPIRYYKHAEARARMGCFQGFAEAEAAQKSLHMAEVISRYSFLNGHSIYGVVRMIGRNYLRRMIEKHAVMIRGHAHQNLEDPFYICMNCLIGYTLGSEYDGYPNDKVDFIFDGKPGSAQATRVIAMYEECRNVIPEPYKSVMGYALPMNDRDVLPLQAADLLAGQVRVAINTKADPDPEPLALMSRHIPMDVRVVDEEIIRETISVHNFAISTRRLLTIQRERDREGK